MMAYVSLVGDPYQKTYIIPQGGFAKYTIRSIMGINLP